MAVLTLGPGAFLEAKMPQGMKSSPLAKKGCPDCRGAAPGGRAKATPSWATAAKARKPDVRSLAKKDARSRDARPGNDGNKTATSVSSSVRWRSTARHKAKKGCVTMVSMSRRRLVGFRACWSVGGIYGPCAGFTATQRPLGFPAPLASCAL